MSHIGFTNAQIESSLTEKIQTNAMITFCSHAKSTEHVFNVYNNTICTCNHYKLMDVECLGLDCIQRLK